MVTKVNMEYKARQSSQIEQYKAVDNIHALPEIFHYWSDKFIRPRLNAVFSADSIVDFYASTIKRSLEKNINKNILSIGSGDCTLEIKVAKRLIDLGENKFKFECLELSPYLLDRALTTIREQDLSQYFSLQEVDINTWTPQDEYQAVMANHSLHHFVNLEGIFDGIYLGLSETGVFVTNDMVGRNGHMRWPEVLEIVESIWNFLPEKLKFNHQLNRLEQNFVNWDCSGEGFEGIRAQDILPLLNKKFNFESFLAFGGIVDVFVDRSFGHNFDHASPLDRNFIDFLQLMNDRLISSGVIKPTTIFAVMSKGGNERKKTLKTHLHWSPEFCERGVSD